MPDVIAEAPAATPNRSLGSAPKSSKDLGLTGMAATMNAALAKGNASPVVTPELIPTTTPIAEPETGLLGALEEPKKPEFKKTTKEDDIKAIKAQRDEHEKNWKTVSAELDTVKKSYVAPDRLTAAEQRAADLEARLETSAIERSPKFARDYVEPRIELIDQAKILAKDILGDDSVVEKALSLTGKARREFLDEAFADHSPSALAEITGSLSAIDTLDRKKTLALTNWKSERDKMSEQERAKAMQEANDERTAVGKAFDAQLPKIASKLPEFFGERIGDLEHNSKVAENIEFVRKALQGDLPTDDMAAIPALAVAAKQLLAGRASDKAEIAKLTERLRAYEKVNPGVQANGEHKDNGNGKPMGMSEYAKRGGLTGAVR